MRSIKAVKGVQNRARRVRMIERSVLYRAIPTTQKQKRKVMPMIIIFKGPASVLLLHPSCQDNLKQIVLGGDTYHAVQQVMKNTTMQSSRADFRAYRSFTVTYMETEDSSRPEEFCCTWFIYFRFCHSSSINHCFLRFF